MSSQFEIELQLIMMRSMNLDHAVANARQDPELLRRMVANLKSRLAEEPTDDDASLLRWAEAMLEMHHLRNLDFGCVDSS